MKRGLASFAALLALITLAAVAETHEFRPVILDVRALGEGRWEVSSSDGAEGEVSLAFPDGCSPEPGKQAPIVITCGDSDLAGRPIAVRGLGASRGDALLRYEGPGGPMTAVLRADSPTFTVPGGPSAQRGPTITRVRGYLGAGVAHVLHGADHLLFVLGLLLLAQGRAAAVARAVTAFTLAHSVTLALAATAAVSLPPAPVEALIALSLVLSAREILRARDNPTAPRRPSLLAFGFGLLHGFGFAGGLADLRVPPSDLPLALLGFNLGVELGQLAFVAVCLFAWALLFTLRLTVGVRHRASLVPAYLIGSLGAFFTLDRLVGLWRP